MEYPIYIYRYIVWLNIDIIDAINRGIILSYSQDLIITLSLIDHMHNSNDFTLNEAEWFYIDGADYEDV